MLAGPAANHVYPGICFIRTGDYRWCLSCIPLMFLATYILYEKIKVAFNDVRNAVSNLNSFVQEHITGMNIVQIFGSEKREYAKFRRSEDHLDANMRSVLLHPIYFPVAEIIAAMGIGLIMVVYGCQERTEYGRNRYHHRYPDRIHYVHPDVLQANPDDCRSVYNTLQMGIVSSSRIINLLDSQEHLMENGTHAPDHIDGDVPI